MDQAGQERVASSWDSLDIAKCRWMAAGTSKNESSSSLVKRKLSDDVLLGPGSDDYQHQSARFINFPCAGEKKDASDMRGNYCETIHHHDYATRRHTAGGRP